MELDGWQARTVDKVLRHDANGDLIARIALISTGRQNGKSVIVRSIFGWLLDEGQYQEPFSSWTTLLAAAHDAKQARIIYSGVGLDLTNRKERKRQMRITKYFGISSGKLVFDTVTGQPGSARGWSAGAIAWDEMLTQRDWDMWEALGPTQSAQRSPLMLLTSTAGHDDSVVLRAFYDRLVRQATGAEAPDPTFYGAWWQSEHPDAGLEWDQLLQANPSLDGGRLSRQALISEHAILPPDSWRRERMNHFVDRRVDSAVSPQLWSNCRTRHPLEGVTGPFALGVDVVPGGRRATIAVAAVRPDGRIGVEVFRDLRPLKDEPVSSQRIIDEIHSFSEPLAYIAFDKVIGAASALERDATESGLPYDGLTHQAMAAASMDVAEMIESRRLAVDDPLLDSQAPHVSVKRFGGEGAFRYSRAQSDEAVDGFMAMMMAAHAIAYTLKKPAIY